MGTPEAMVFFEPQKTAAISSSTGNANLLTNQVDNPSTRARISAAPKNASASTPKPLFRHYPDATESQNAVYTKIRITQRSRRLV